MSDTQSPIPIIEDEPTAITPNLANLPPVFVLPTHLSLVELHQAEDQLSDRGAPLTYDIAEAKLVIGKISTIKRAEFELRGRKVRFENVRRARESDLKTKHASDDDGTTARKRQRLSHREEVLTPRPKEKVIDDDSTASEIDEGSDSAAKPMSQLSISQTSTSATLQHSDQVGPKESSPPPFVLESFTNVVKVVNIEWLEVSIAAGKPQRLEPYTIYEARLLPSLEKAINNKRNETIAAKAEIATVVHKSPYMTERTSQGIIERAKADFIPRAVGTRRRDRTNQVIHEQFAGRTFASSTQAARQSRSQSITKRTSLLRQTTSEHDEGVNSTLPEMPDWVKGNKIYSCQRATPITSLNEEFMDQLEKIKLSRVLTADEIGVRAYSTSIASLAAYPHKLSSTAEILALPGCDQKIAHLFHEWKTSDHRIQAVEDIEADPTLKVLNLFYEIWGVGALTARDFYYNKNWRDLDDIVEQGWQSLSRVQQIGLKYYDEFQLKIPRSEVEHIASIVTTHAKRIVDPDIECIIVGGHRRGKPESGDCDLILTHRSSIATQNLVAKVVASLEREDWITHTLTLNLTNSKRDQQPLPLISPHPRGAGFDTLDKALVVWQDQSWPSKSRDLAADPAAKNPNPHRRVDIIVSSWRTIGCAVVGWSAGTTFQRDLRRYAKHVKGWKFDSSGVRERGSGRWVDLEGWANEGTRCRGWEEAERRVFEGMGLVWREPWERCTG
ncbi:hypothetical protein MMC12_000034 [Toensbergia leucococca]|nr:hypothetical protein [Toensbergia leucococca]